MSVRGPPAGWEGRTLAGVSAIKPAPSVPVQVRGTAWVSTGVQTVLAGGERHNSKPTHAFSSVEGIVCSISPQTFCFYFQITVFLSV